MRPPHRFKLTFRSAIARGRILSASPPEPTRGPRHTRSPRWGGAIAGWELTRLARRGSPTVARLLVGLLLFAALFVTYLAAFPRDLEQLAGFNPGEVQATCPSSARTSPCTFLLVQAAVVLSLTPLFVAGSIVEETERRTLEFLLATDLSPREIVLGKLWPRLLLVFGDRPGRLAGPGHHPGVGRRGRRCSSRLASLVVLGEMWAVAGISAALRRRRREPPQGDGQVLLLVRRRADLPVFTCPFGVIAVLADAHADSIYAVERRTRRRPIRGRWRSSDDARRPSVIAESSPARTVPDRPVGHSPGVLKLRHAAYFYARMPWQERTPQAAAMGDSTRPCPKGPRFCGRKST